MFSVKGLMLAVTDVFGTLNKNGKLLTDPSMRVAAFSVSIFSGEALSFLKHAHF